MIDDDRTIPHGNKMSYARVLPSLMTGLLSLVAYGENPPVMPRDHLVLHLDASIADSIDADADDRVLVWRDLSPCGHHAHSRKDHRPRVQSKGLNGRSVVRFEPPSFLDVGPWADGPGGVTAFAVFQRPEVIASDRAWQRVLSAWDGATKNDTTHPSFFLDTGKDGSARTPRVLVELGSAGTFRGGLRIGSNMMNGQGSLLGDLAEIVIYDRTFLVHEQVAQVKNYLIAKWGIVEDTTTDWTMRGPLPESPLRRTDEWPLSDQDNQGSWTRMESLCDEFAAANLDSRKWWDHNPNWFGRAPSRFQARNVTVEDGHLGLTLRIDPSLSAHVVRGQGSAYHTYSSASVVGKEWVRYGYFEVRARPMPSAGSSSFWFSGSSYDQRGGNHRTEIDVFELGGRAPGFEKKYNMNAHIFSSPLTGRKHLSKGGSWQAPEPFANDFHVFGLEWTPSHIRYFVDGVLVRSMDNTDWHAPMALIFDSETMFDWLGKPRDEDLPSTYLVDYVRSWKNEETGSDWRREFTLRENRNSRITRYVREMDATYKAGHDHE